MSKVGTLQIFFLDRQQMRKEDLSSWAWQISVFSILVYIFFVHPNVQMSCFGECLQCRNNFGLGKPLKGGFLASVHMANVPHFQ